MYLHDSFLRGSLPLADLILPSHPKITELNHKYGEWYFQSVVVFEVDEKKNNHLIVAQFVQ